ncbi:MAG: hypothetical protein H7Y07_14905, partial [Pyrinomonadaceae bacterium]|nr:hypothetical protein [Sphingobacteriaceae bacterium]
SKKQIGSLSEQAWDRYPIIKEVDLNIIEHSEEVCRKYLKYLRDEIFWLIRSTMERCDFDSWAKDLNFTQDVLNGINIAPQGFSLSTILKENCTFRNFFSFVHGFINEANEVIEFLDQRLTSISDDIGNDWTNKFEPIRLTDICSNNEIPTIFYNLKMNGKINTDWKNLKRVLMTIIRDKDGNELSESYLDTIFNHSKPLARSKKV